MSTDFSPVDLATARERLRELIKDLAVVRGKVTLASGIEADYYVDLRRVTLHHEASRYVGQVMLGLLDEAGIEFDAAGGLTMGAEPPVVEVSSTTTTLRPTTLGPSTWRPMP